MRALSFATLAVAVLASKDTAPMKKSVSTTTTMFEKGLIKWEMTAETINYLDEGFEYLRLTHVLTAPIRATDQIEFTINFTSSYDPWINKENISEDVAICKMT